MSDVTTPSTTAVCGEICERISLGKVVRRNLPEVGSIFLDTLRPFLCVYRSPPDRPDAGTKGFVTTEAAYLFGSGQGKFHTNLSNLCNGIADHIAEELGAFLLIEIWSGRLGGHAPDGESLPSLAFQIVYAREELGDVVSVLQQGLRDIHFGYEPASVEIQRDKIVAPPGMAPLLGAPRPGVYTLGIQIDPVYRDEHDQTLFPALLRELRAQVSGAIQRAVFKFSQTKTRESREHFQEFGARALLKVTGSFDERLSDVADAFDFLLQVTPINIDVAWQNFQESGFQKAPIFHYRPLAYEAEELKRQLFEIPIVRLEDATTAFLLEEKQTELDLQISALREIGNKRFLYACLQLYGEPEPGLVELAEEVMDELKEMKAPSDDEEQCSGVGIMRRAKREIAYYHRVDQEFKPSVEIRSDIASGILVSQGVLMISDSTTLSGSRVHALLQHEVGTHLVTYFNGSHQRLAQLRGGLAGYERLQEGLAVLSEYLVGDLPISRSRTLAARVLAVRWVIDGATFVEIYQRLVDEFNFSPKQAFTISMRVLRGGGYVKDMIYLQGLRDLQMYLAKGHDLVPMFVGKIGLGHVPYIEELIRRRVVAPPRLLPRFLKEQSCLERLEACRKLSVKQILLSGKPQ